MPTWATFTSHVWALGFPFSVSSTTAGRNFPSFFFLFLFPAKRATAMQHQPHNSGSCSCKNESTNTCTHTHTVHETLVPAAVSPGPVAINGSIAVIPGLSPACWVLPQVSFKGMNSHLITGKKGLKKKHKPPTHCSYISPRMNTHIT